jgi:hypothetical protein
MALGMVSHIDDDCGVTVRTMLRQLPFQTMGDVGRHAQSCRSTAELLRLPYRSDR